MHGVRLVIPLRKKNSSPRFCVDHRHTLNRPIVWKSWQLLDMVACLDAVGGTSFITVADVMSAPWQPPVGEKDVDSKTFVTHPRKYVFLRMHFGVCNAPWLLQHTISMILGHLGPDLGVHR